MLFVGDDWAEDHHDVGVVGEDGRRLGVQRLPGGPSGIAALHALIARLVLPVREFDDEDEALAVANDSRSGLPRNGWTSDVRRMLRLAARLESGTIWGNSSRVMDPALPFGGFKDSGVGNAYVDGAIAGTTRLKRVSLRYRDDVPLPRWAG